MNDIDIDIAEVPEHELGDATIPGGAAVRGEAADPGLGHEEAGTGQCGYTVQYRTQQYSTVQYSGTRSALL